MTLLFLRIVYFCCAGSSLQLGLSSRCGLGAALQVPRLPLVVASLVVEEGLQGMWGSGFAARGLSRISGSWALGHRLNSYGAQASCSEACGIFLDQGRNPCLLHWQVDSSPLSYHRRPSMILLNCHILEVKTLASPSPLFLFFLSYLPFSISYAISKTFKCLPLN